MNEKEKFIALGRITRPYGLKGAVHLYSYGDDAAFLEYDALFLPDSHNHPRMLRISWVRIKKPGRIVVQFREIRDRYAASALAGTEVFITASSLPEPGEGEIYRHEITGLQVITTQGEKLGHIVGIMETAGHDIYVVNGEGGREILIPAVKQIVISIDTEAGSCTIDPPPGLLNANDH